MHIAAVAAEARMDRKARTQLLEDDVARMEGLFAQNADEKGDKYDELTIDQVVKLMDQKRKTLEAIAKERSEWGRDEVKPQESRGAWVLEMAGKTLALQEAAAAHAEPAALGALQEHHHDEREREQQVDCQDNGFHGGSKAPLSRQRAL